MKLPKFRLFDYETPGPGVEKNAPPKKGIARFGDILLKRFWKMVTVNFLFLVFSIPALLINWFLTSFILSYFFSTVIPIEVDEGIAEGISLMCMYLPCFMAGVFGTGAPTAGMTYVIRNYTIDTHAWAWADFWSTFKHKFVKATAIYLIDTVLVSLLTINFCFYGTFAGENLAAYLLQGLMIVVFLILLLMHSYIYPILVSFDKKVFQIYKDSFILAIGKLPTTLLSTLLTTLVCGVVTYLACFVTIYAMLLIPIIMFAFSCYVNLSISYPMIQKYMLKKSED